MQFSAKRVLKHPWIAGNTAKESNVLLSPALLSDSMNGKTNEAIRSKISNLRKQIRS